MPDYASSTNDEFGTGIDHVANAGRANDNSLTLGGSLQATGDRWNAMTPHSVIRTALGGSQADDGTYEQYSRTSGGYEPGSMPAMTDQIDQGSDNTD